MLLIDWERLPENMRCREVRMYYDILLHRKKDLVLKRVFDIVFSFLLLVLLSPIFVIIAAAVVADSPGPVFFCQVRVTACGKRFKIVKFRTMITDSEKTGSYITVNNDKRITGIGKYLRQSRLDELPQLWNILCGDMTFVGTRPEVERYTVQYSKWMMATLLLPAGITSLASINYRDESRLLDAADDVERIYLEEILPSKMRINLQAIEDFSFVADLKILLMTVLSVFGKRFASETEKSRNGKQVPKIAFCTVSSVDLYQSRRELIHLFADKGYEVILLSPEPFDCGRYFQGSRISHCRVPISRTGINPFSDIKTYIVLRKMIRNRKPDVIFAFSGAKAVIYSALASSASASTSSICMINGLGSIYRVDTPKNKAVRMVMNVLYRAALGHSDIVCFQNKDDRDVFIEHKLVSRGKCKLVAGAGVNLSYFPETPLPSEPLCLFVGRLLKDKGIYEYVEAAKIVRRKRPEAKFAVVGALDSNPMSIGENELQRWIREGIIEYWGKRDDMYEVYSRCRIFILPSHHEGMPRSVLEAMAVGRPIITTDAPGCRDTIDNGYNGFCVPVGASDEIADRVLELLDHDDLCKRMAAASRRKAEATYDVNSINNFIYSLVDQVAEQAE